MEVVVAVGVGWGCLDCSTGLGAVKSEGPDPVLPTLGKANVGFVVEGVVPVVVTGAGWLVGNENVCAGVAVGLEVVVAGGTGVTGLEKKLGTAVLLVVEGPGFVVEGGMVVVAGLAKKFGTADCVGAGTEFEDVGTGVGAANKFFAGSLVSVVAVVPVVGFDCVEVAEVGMDKLGVVVVEVVVAGAGAGEGFFSSSLIFFWS